MWIVGRPVPNDNFYSVSRRRGEFIAIRVTRKEYADRIARLPELESIEKLVRLLSAVGYGDAELQNKIDLIISNLPRRQEDTR